MEFGQFVIFYFSTGIFIFLIGCTSWMRHLLQVGTEEQEFYFVLLVITGIFLWPFGIMWIVMELGPDLFYKFIEKFFSWIPRLIQWTISKLTKIFIG